LNPANRTNLHDTTVIEIPEVQAPTSWRRLKRLSEDEIDEVVAARLTGVEILALAERFGVSRSTIDRHLRLRDVAKQRWHGRTLDGEQLRAAGRVYAGGFRLELVAEQFGVDRRYLRKVLPAAGFPIRQAGQQRRC
jgi:hypothetical protein